MKAFPKNTHPVKLDISESGELVAHDKFGAVRPVTMSEPLRKQFSETSRNKDHSQQRRPQDSVHLIPSILFFCLGLMQGALISDKDDMMRQPVHDPSDARSTTTVSPAPRLIRDDLNEIVYDHPRPLTFDEAQTFCKNLVAGDVNGWRLPSLHDLSITFNNYSENIPNFPEGYYWSSTIHEDNYAWYRRSADGFSFILDKSHRLSVRCVRG